MGNKSITRALISVTDKAGIIEVAKALIANKVEIIASDGSAAVLRSAEIPVKTISEVTGFPEILQGRVKTLHPLIHGAILADSSDSAHRADLKKFGIEPIDLVIVNLYEPSFFDIGGPALIRAAAKNHAHVLVITSTAQYGPLIDGLHNGFDEKFRLDAARLAIETTARYDLAILRDLGEQLRYGENPHQRAWIAGQIGLAAARSIQGKAMSYNNYLDLDAALKCLSSFADPTAVIIKHGIPTGIATQAQIADSYAAALQADELSAFGGVVGLNRAVDTSLASSLSETFFEVICAPHFTESAREILQQKKNLRLIELSPEENKEIALREIDGGFLFQEPDTRKLESDSAASWRLVAGNAVTPETLRDLEFAWRAIRSIRSNAILLAKDGSSVGIGAGQVNRLDAALQAIGRAGSKAHGAVAASDAFFPFSDGPIALAQAGIIAIVQPGGSVRDQDIIDAVASAGMSMYFTGDRHFSH